MANQPGLSRRNFIALSAMLPLALRTPAASSIPVGLELYSVRNTLKQDLEGTVRAVAQMGYQCVEFYAPYFDWTEAQTRDMRKLLDDLGVRCYSTHNNADYLSKDNISKTRDRNQILGCKYVVIASTHAYTDLEGWKTFAGTLNCRCRAAGTRGSESRVPQSQGGVRPYRWRPSHGSAREEHQADRNAAAGRRHVSRSRRRSDRLDSRQSGAHPLAALQGLVARSIQRLHGAVRRRVADWKAIFQAAESGGGVEYYLIEQEGSRLSELDTAKTCLDLYRKLRS